MVPTNYPIFDETGARWISINGSGEGPDFDNTTGPRGVYLYRKTFQVPATAYNLSGSAGIASDNYAWLYLNGNLLLNPKDSSKHDRNFCGLGSATVCSESDKIGPSTSSISLASLACSNVLAAEVQNGISSGRNGPTGVVFALDIAYETPDVVWLPPVTNADFTLQDGTTLPLKFNLFRQDGTLITDLENVYLKVKDGESVVEMWSLGDGIENLRFDPYEYYYIANFKTKNYGLSDGTTLTADVYDECTGDSLGSISFIVYTSKGTGRGNSGK
jgi:hypothetical protein